MSDQDGGNSVAEFKWIKDSGSLDNRLGALYSSIHKFIKIRVSKGMLCCNMLDTVDFDWFTRLCWVMIQDAGKQSSLVCSSWT